ncbi:hypothetical protein D3C76_1380940 [compost metagenome]
MVDGDVAGAAQQIGAEFFNLYQGASPEPHEQVLHQVRRRGPATHATTHQRFHLRTLGEKHLEKMRTIAAWFAVLDLGRFGSSH